MIFRSLGVASPDPILGLTEAFNRDARTEKINLAAAEYKNAAGMTPIMGCVREAEQRLLETEEREGYADLDGVPGFGRHVHGLLFGADHEIIAQDRARTVQTLGGTGALRIAAEFIGKHFPKARIWCSNPTWPNHPNVFRSVGVEAKTFSYYDRHQNSCAIAGLLHDLRQIPPGDVVCLQACCHNPTGADPGLEDWKEISNIIHQNEIIPLIDIAYQGFGDALDEDASGLRELCEASQELLICSSFSNNFGVYSGRVGALTVVGAKSNDVNVAIGHIKTCVRVNYSAPPHHGAAIVVIILEDGSLRVQWKRELADAREHIKAMRKLFAATMKAHDVSHDFSFIEAQRGMFSVSGLTQTQIEKLQTEHAVYVVRDGRINLSAVNERNVEPLADAIKSVLQN